ncbi:hypothetical protein HDV00_000051 [Rhizophlyctis rosea]|nr:hypothetical protein HDV00_000051 [Rhizophlyctis rosea]
MIRPVTFLAQRRCTSGVRRTLVRHMSELSNSQPTVYSTSAPVAPNPPADHNNGVSAVQSGTAEQRQDYAKPVQTRDHVFPTSGAFENELVRSQSQVPFQDQPSYEGFASEGFSDEVADILLAPIPEGDIEIKPDGLLYLPEIKYRRILNRAFRPGGWGLVPKGPHTVIQQTVSREYALYCHGRFVAQARGEQDFFSDGNLPTATEGAKSNALIRCCKDLGIASELWDPIFIKDFKERMCEQKQVKNNNSGAVKQLWRRKDRSFEYPLVETEGSAAGASTYGTGRNQFQRRY